MALLTLFELSPAMRRYLRRSVWPLLLAPVLGVAAGWVLANTTVEQSAPRLAVVAVSVALLLWMFIDYLRFLRECDELERRIEILSLAMATGLTALLGIALILLELMALKPLPEARMLLADIGLCFVVVYALLRLGLMWRYR